MASTNINRPNGLSVSRYLGGAPFNGQTEIYTFSASQANNAYVGDLVQFDSSNRSIALTVEPYRGIQAVKPVVAALTTNTWRGVIAGFVPQPDFNMSVTASLGVKYRVLSTQRFVWVTQDPNIVYTVQEDGNSYVSTSSNALNKTVDITYTAGSAITGISGVQIASASAQTSVALPIRVLRYTQTVDNFGFSASDTLSYAKFDVLSANSDLVQAVATQFGA